MSEPNASFDPMSSLHLAIKSVVEPITRLAEALDGEPEVAERAKSALLTIRHPATFEVVQAQNPHNRAPAPSRPADPCRAG